MNIAINMHWLLQLAQTDDCVDVSIERILI